MNEEKTTNVAPAKSSATVVALVLGVVVVAFVIFSLSASKNQVPQNTAVEAVSPTSNEPVTTTGPIKTFTVVGTSFAFDPSTITVDKGDTVKLVFKDNDGRHNLIVDGYDVSTKVLNQGQEQEVTFIADKTGSFKIYCSLPGHEDNGMTGTLIVN